MSPSTTSTGMPRQLGRRHPGVEVQGRGLDGAPEHLAHHRRHLGHVPVIHAGNPRRRRERLGEDAGFHHAGPGGGQVLVEHGGVQEGELHAGLDDGLLDRHLLDVVLQLADHRVDHGREHDAPHSGRRRRRHEGQAHPGLVLLVDGCDAERRPDALQRRLDAGPVPQVADGDLGRPVPARLPALLLVARQLADRHAPLRQGGNDQSCEAACGADDEDLGCGTTYGHAPPDGMTPTWSCRRTLVCRDAAFFPKLGLRMDRVAATESFVRTVERGSFAAAAGRGLSATMVGNHVRFPEHRLGALLLHRATRQQSMTEFGRGYCERCRAILAEIEAAETAAEAMQAVPRGLLRVTAPVALGTTVLPSLLAGHLRRQPEVTVDLVLQDHRLDLLADELDVAIRAGTLPDSSMVARALPPLQLVVCALQSIRVNAFDPGMMPGTGLARTYAPVMRFAWHYILPALTLFMRNVNTPSKSGKRLAQLAAGSEGSATGTYFSDGRETRSSELSLDKAKALDLWNGSADMAHLPRDLSPASSRPALRVAS